jgi:hypothetical protein
MVSNYTSYRHDCVVCVYCNSGNINQLGATTMYQAKPNLNNKRGMKTFKTEEEAAQYLNKITGISMPKQDWKMLSKLIKIYS